MLILLLSRETFNTSSFIVISLVALKAFSSLAFCSCLCHIFQLLNLVKPNRITTKHPAPRKFITAQTYTNVLATRGLHHVRLILRNESLKTLTPVMNSAWLEFSAGSIFAYCFGFRKRETLSFMGLPQYTVKLQVYTLWILSFMYRVCMWKQSLFYFAFWEPLQDTVNCQFLVTFSSLVAPKGNLTLEL